MNTIKKMAALAALLTASTSVWAEGSWIDCQPNGNAYLFFTPANIDIGKDAGVKDLLGPWQNAEGPNIYTCTPYAASANLSVAMAVTGGLPTSVSSAGYTLEVDGQSYRVYSWMNTGLGYIARWRYTINGQSVDWLPLTATSTAFQNPTVTIPVPYNNGAPFSISADVQIRFVKTAATLKPGLISPYNTITLRHYQKANNQSFISTDFKTAQVIGSTFALVSTNGTCTTPNVTVTLPEANASDFTGPGSTAARKDFTLNFNQCPAGLGSIGYTFSPTTSVLDSANGVVALNSTSSAAGVGIQLLTKNNTPVTYNSAYLLDDYDASLTNANYSVPMTAGLYQTGASITPGEANSAVNFTLTYK